MHGIAKQVLGRRRLHIRLVHGAAKETLEPGARRAKRRRRGERKVNLQAAGEQKDTIEAGSAGHIEQMDGVELGDEAARPVVEHFKHWHSIYNGEGQVKI